MNVGDINQHDLSIKGDASLRQLGDILKITMTILKVRLECEFRDFTVLN